VYSSPKHFALSTRRAALSMPPAGHIAVGMGVASRNISLNPGARVALRTILPDPGARVISLDAFSDV